MGLDVCNNNNSHRVGSYKMLHVFRYAAYRFCGGKVEFGEFVRPTEEIENSPAFTETVKKFPNLLMHSDCGGWYKKDGKTVDFFAENIGENEWLEGNSVALLEEMKILTPFIEAQKWMEDYQKNSFVVMLEIVREAVEELDGEVEFC